MNDTPHADDDLYLHSGETYDGPPAYYPKEPEAQVDERRKEHTVIAASYPIMADIADWFRTEIDACDRISNIETRAISANGMHYSLKVSIEAQVLAYQLLREKLEGKLQQFAQFGKALDSEEKSDD